MVRYVSQYRKYGFWPYKRLLYILRPWKRQMSVVEQGNKEHKISTSQMQYNADYKETDQEDQCLLYLRGNGPR